MSDYDDDKPTPPRGSTPSPYVLSETERHRRKYARGVPVVLPDPAAVPTAPVELLLNGELATEDYAQLEALRRAADPLVLLFNLAKAITGKIETDQSSSAELERSVAVAIDTTAKAQADHERRLASVEGTIGTVKGHSWKVALAIVGTLAGSATAIIATLQSKAEAAGAAAQRDADQQRRIDRLERLLDERPSPRDYDYDLIPRRATPAQPRKDP